jgi:RNA polymerase sigma-70 factor (ECF subfamily)
MEHSNQLQSPGVIPDQELINRILAGEKDLYAWIIRRYNARLYRVGMAMINDDAEVEEAMQVAYIKAYEHLAKFAFRSSFSTWLTRILINECLLRLKKRKTITHLNELVMNSAVFPLHSPDAQTPASKACNTELRHILEAAIRQLPEIYRTVFVMREIENMNVQETKECLDISEVNVKVRLNRAKSLLRASLSHYYNKEDILHFHCLRCDRMVEQVIRKIEQL